MISTEQLLVVEQTINALIDQHHALLDIGFPASTAMQVTRAFQETFCERCVQLGMTHAQFTQVTGTIWITRIKAMFPNDRDEVNRMVDAFVRSGN